MLSHLPSRKLLFAADKVDFRKPQSIELQSCGAQSQRQRLKATPASKDQGTFQKRGRKTVRPKGLRWNRTGVPVSSWSPGVQLYLGMVLVFQKVIGGTRNSLGRPIPNGAFVDKFGHHPRGPLDMELWLHLRDNNPYHHRSQGGEQLDASCPTLIISLFGLGLYNCQVQQLPSILHVKFF